MQLPPDPPPIVLDPPEYPFPDDPADTTDTPNPPPATIENLAVVGTSWDRLRLRWSSPKDPGGTGIASEYDLRFQEADLPRTDPELWGVDETVLAPDLPGQIEFHEVSGLRLETEYVFRLRTRDLAGNWSEWSNQVVHRTFHHREPPVWVRNIGGDGPVLVSPAGVAVGPDGTVFISDPGMGFVNLYDDTGAYQGQFSPGVDSATLGAIAADADGTLLVTMDSRVGRYTRSGELILEDELILEPNEGTNAVSIAPDGRIALGILGGASIHDSQFNLEGSWVNWIGSVRDMYQRYGLVAIAWVSNERLCAAFQDGEIVLHPIGSRGGIPVVDPNYQLAPPAGVATYPFRAIYLSDKNQRRGIVLDPIGNPVFEWPILGSSAGAGSDLGAVAVGPDESIFIIDLAAGLVRVFAYED